MTPVDGAARRMPPYLAIRHLDIAGLTPAISDHKNPCAGLLRVPLKLSVLSKLSSVDHSATAASSKLVLRRSPQTTLFRRASPPVAPLAAVVSLALGPIARLPATAAAPDRRPPWPAWPGRAALGSRVAKRDPAWPNPAGSLVAAP